MKTLKKEIVDRLNTSSMKSAFSIYMDVSYSAVDHWLRYNQKMLLKPRALEVISTLLEKPIEELTENSIA